MKRHATAVVMMAVYAMTVLPALAAEPTPTSVVAAPAAATTVPQNAKEPQSTERRDYRQPVCVITGKITGTQAIEKTPWTDGTPSTLTVTEVHMSVKVDSRRPQRPNMAADDCPMPENGNSLYKLCSPTQIKLGDVVMGTEGLATGSDSALGCLFDVVVIPEKPVPAPAPAAP